ncbi:MAG: adenylate/guanylate cyclase domain-containing protein [Gammaproteobacteria bacterium]
MDDLIHDSAVVANPRTAWKNTAIIALDHEIPEYISRKQALPLFGLAAERALNNGAVFVFMDATIFESSPNMQYATCIDSKEKHVNWNNLSESFNPLYPITPGNIHRFSIPPTSPNVELLTLFRFETALEINEPEFFTDVHIYHRNNNLFTPMARLMNLSPNALPAKITTLMSRGQRSSIPIPDAGDVPCGNELNKYCRRIRFSKFNPEYKIDGEFPVIPLSALVQCDSEISPKIRDILKDRIIVIQLTTLDEATDVHITPMTTSFSGTGRLTLGSQILIDTIETMLAGDHPKRPELVFRIIVIILAGFISVFAAAYLKSTYAFTAAALNIILTIALCFKFSTVQLWPISAVALTSLIGFFLCLSAHLALGTKRGMMIAKYLPSPIRSMLLSAGNNKFINKKTNAVVLISDLRGYTMASSLLKDPEIIFNLINQYLEETTIIIQETYHGWLENYVGDLVCFYWPADNKAELESQKKLAIQAAIVQADLQQSFFKSLKTRKNIPVDNTTINKISEIISAGIGVSTGSIVMGNIGPEAGVQKFGVLGEPLNLSSRIESLTRLFNTEIIITEELVDTAQRLNYKVRKIAHIAPKGKTAGCNIFALGKPDDIRFSDKLIKQWEYFYYLLVERSDFTATAPEIFRQDAATLKDWYNQGVFDKETKTWVLTQK